MRVGGAKKWEGKRKTKLKKEEINEYPLHSLFKNEGEGAIKKGVRKKNKFIGLDKEVNLFVPWLKKKINQPLNLWSKIWGENKT